jgi:hypothetical protein
VYIWRCDENSIVRLGSQKILLIAKRQEIFSTKEIHDHLLLLVLFHHHYLKEKKKKKESGWLNSTEE